MNNKKYSFSSLLITLTFSLFPLILLSSCIGDSKGTASFELTVSSTGNGIITSFPEGITCGDTCATTFKKGKQISLIAIPTSGAGSVKWSNACQAGSIANECIIKLTKDTRVNVSFEAGKKLLEIQATGGGQGNISTQDKAIDCNSSHCSAEFYQDELVVLQANPSQGSLFEEWIGPCRDAGDYGLQAKADECVIVLQQDTMVMASFTSLIHHTVHVDTSSEYGFGTGVVVSYPGGIACGEHCEFDFNEGREIELVAYAGEHSQLLEWIGDCAGQGENCMLSVQAPIATEAVFTQSSCPINSHDLNGDPSDGCEYLCVFESMEDRPDLDRIDANCDGVDGELAAAIFVDLANGDNTNPGSAESPVQTIQAGMSKAIATGKSALYIAEGTYMVQTLELENGISLFGGYRNLGNGIWETSTSATTTVKSEGVKGISGTDLQDNTELGYITLEMSPLSPSSYGASAYGIWCQNCPGLSLWGNTIQVANGIPGQDGTLSPFVQPTAPGGDDGENALCDDTERPGGAGGSYGLSYNDGAGGKGGDGTSGSRDAGDSGIGSYGNGGSTAFNYGAGGTGSIGQAGYAGARGYHGSIVSGLWQSEDGKAGEPGRLGGGGGGGRSGAGFVDSLGPLEDVHYSGASGGGGGAGGHGGAGGGGGTGGGGSFGVFLIDSTGASIKHNTIVTGNGGQGGDGASPQSGAPGGDGGQGGEGRNCTYADLEAAGDGGNGGRGGHGGAGGGGAGGPSIGILLKETFDISNDPGNFFPNSFQLGLSGNGGDSSGNSGTSGNRQNIWHY